MPRGKEPGKELCDILVVCDPHIIIFSIKDIGLKETSDPTVGWERWRKKAIDASSRQNYGAQRWISSASNVITNDGEKGLAFPEASRRRIHRVAVALGSLITEMTAAIGAGNTSDAQEAAGSYSQSVRSGPFVYRRLRKLP
jgi:hypothetical protein